MPRRRSRFSDLERQFRESGGVAAPGSRLAGYIDYKKGINQVQITQRLTAEQRKRFGFAVLPFNISPPDTVTAADRYAAPITAYSNAIRGNIGLSNNQCGYENIVAATQQSENFYPALLRVFIPNGNTATPVSAITKKEYTRKLGQSASIPFGRTITSVTDAKKGTAETSLADADEEDVRQSLAAAARAGTGNAKASSVSYDPEVFRVGKPDLASPI